MHTFLHLIEAVIWKPAFFLANVLGNSAGMLWLVFCAVVPLAGGIGLYRIRGRMSWKRIAMGLTAVIAGGAIAVTVSTKARTYHPRPPQFEGLSTLLPKTQVAPTLDTPVEPSKNVIWCASFQAAWKELEAGIAKEPLHVPGAEAVEALLNTGPVPEVPEGDLYTEVGWEDKGIVNTICEEKARRFPGSASPEFPGIIPGSFIMYAYLQSQCPFSVPYRDSAKPMAFRSSDGTVSEVRAFGLCKEDEYAYREIRKQVGILSMKLDSLHRASTFVLDLCKDSPSIQVVFARTTLRKSLRETLAAINADIAGGNTWAPEFIDSDVLLVPEIAFHIIHHFRELEGLKFANAALKGAGIDVALQEVQFRLDRSGAELISETKMYTRSSGLDYVGDGPFLVYLKKRGAMWPYFVLWVENDELLNKWQANSGSAHRTGGD